MPDIDTSTPIPYRLRVSKRARRMRIVIHRDSVEVVVPTHTSPATAERFVASSRDWIVRTLAKLPPLEPPEAPNPFADLPLFAHVAPLRTAPRIDVVQLRGMERTVAVKYIQAPLLRGRAKMIELTSRPNTLVVYCADPEAPPRHAVRTLLREWVREQAKVIFPAYIHALADELGIRRPTDIRIGFQRTVWGSRSVSGCISLSATLLFLPPHLLRHVAVHELCHTLHMNHGRRFHETLERYDPLAERHAAELKKAETFVPAWIHET